MSRNLFNVFIIIIYNNNWPQKSGNLYFFNLKCIYRFFKIHFNSKFFYVFKNTFFLQKNS